MCMVRHMIESANEITFEKGTKMKKLKVFTVIVKFVDSKKRVSYRCISTSEEDAIRSVIEYAEAVNEVKVDSSYIEIEFDSNVVDGLVYPKTLMG